MILTESKKRWAKNRNVTLRGTRLNYNVGAQIKYVNALTALVSQMTFETKKQIKRLFKGKLADDFFDQQAETSAMDASITVAAKKLVKKLTDKYAQLFNDKANTLAESMVDTAAKVSKITLRESLKQLSGGLSLKTGVVPEGMEDVAQASVNENVSLIKSLPEQYFTNVSGAVMRSITTGNGLHDLIPAIEKFTGSTHRRAKNIALDQTRKAYNTINRQRMQKIGVKQFEWVHSGGGQHPRRSHQAMSGNIYSFDDLPVINQEQVDAGSAAPVTGIPGDAINCKCTMVPVIRFDDE